MSPSRRNTADSDPFRSSESLETGAVTSEVSPSVHGMIASGDRNSYGTALRNSMFGEYTVADDYDYYYYPVIAYTAS
jgi:hypothetical protein